ncbi:SRPBCC family protein [Actinokineospora sp. PR83]|uniref:SRPBCC family protein n=1 Tax=Actinokineospora sp. PR83 TaxID=2884908 RepID=UPI001F18BC77|nr:SRPBCC family protein [Actinokineospora sp. PR83]MCG8918329.1 SRPBCC family protein [Actinokineospora sp. PR83]
MIDIAHQLAAVHRAVSAVDSPSGEVVGVVLRRRYDAAVEDVWDAVTDPGRLARWFLPISGDLRVGGAFQLDGSAGGEIQVCEAPALLQVTFGGPTSVVRLRLTGNDGATDLELEHTVPIEIAGSGAGALYVGPGWDEAFKALALFFDGALAEDPIAASNSVEGQEFCRGSIEAWVAVVEASGTASAAEVAAATEAAMAQFAPDLDRNV